MRTWRAAESSGIWNIVSVLLFLLVECDRGLRCTSGQTPPDDSVDDVQDLVQVLEDVVKLVLRPPDRWC
jgi:hypothetical protein